MPPLPMYTAVMLVVGRRGSLGTQAADRSATTAEGPTGSLTRSSLSPRSATRLLRRWFRRKADRIGWQDAG